MGMAGFVGVYGWVWKKAGEKGRVWLEWGLAALVAGVSAVSVATHEPWGDELHAWLQARDLTVRELWREMHYEGHFLPWHLILHPFARLGAPVETMGWISWAINAVAMIWFARKAPLGGWAKAAAALSCVFLYVNPVISRPYALVPPSLWGVASLWRKRDERPVAFGLWVALLANTHVCMEGTAVSVFLVYTWRNAMGRLDGKGWRECRWQWAGLGVMAAGIAVAAAQVLPSLWESRVEIKAYMGWQEAAACFAMGCFTWGGAIAMLAGLIGLGVACAPGRNRNGEILSVYAGSMVFMLCFSVFFFPANVINRALLWWPLALGVAWMLAEGDGAGSRGWLVEASVLLMGLGVMRPDLSVSDWRREYDPLRGACKAIAERYGTGAEVWIEGDNFGTEGAAAYLDNVMDWETGRRAERITLKKGGQKAERPFSECMGDIFRERQDADRLLAIVTVRPGAKPDFLPPAIEVLHWPEHSLSPWSGWACALVIRSEPAGGAMR